MRVKIRFRYRADTGEVELFEVDDLQAGPRLADHDARHDRVAADVARIVESNALIEELPYAAGAAPVTETRPAVAQPAAEHQSEQRERSTDG